VTSVQIQRDGEQKVFSLLSHLISSHPSSTLLTSHPYCTCRRVVEDDDEAEFDDEEVKQPQKKQKKPVSAPVAVASSTSDNSEERVFSLGQKKKISLSKFKGKVYVNIREYYTDDSGVDKVHYTDPPSLITCSLGRKESH
jgi:hypothetical protein